MPYYKIRRISTGLWESRTFRWNIGNFTEKEQHARIWKTLGAVKLHLNGSAVDNLEVVDAPRTRTMAIDEYRAERSIQWLIENYAHIWWSPDLTPTEKEAFLAASCHPTRCYLMTVSLRERIDVIRGALGGMLTAPPSEGSHVGDCASGNPGLLAAGWKPDGSNGDR